MSDQKHLLSVPDKTDKRADALRANLKRRKAASKSISEKQKENADKPDKA